LSRIQAKVITPADTENSTQPILHVKAIVGRHRQPMLILGR
jgi:hypothetical protein